MDPSKDKQSPDQPSPEPDKEEIDVDDAMIEEPKDDVFEKRDR